eukprot:9287858-Pyramimonas_sp.AAC.1
MSNSFQNLHHRREDAVIVVGVINIGAVTGRAVVAVNIVTSIATIIIVSTVVDVAMIPRSRRSRQTSWPLRARACAGSS